MQVSYVRFMRKRVLAIVICIVMSVCCWTDCFAISGVVGNASDDAEYAINDENKSDFSQENVIKDFDDDHIFEESSEEIINETEQSADMQDDSDTEIIASGICGTNNLKWELDNNGTLSIIGKGYMYSNKTADVVPWKKYRADIKKINLDPEIKKIGRYAFYGCENIEQSIKIPDNVYMIEAYAFYNCRGISEVTFNDGIEYIYEAAFGYCTGLTHIELPKSLIEIREQIFFKCVNIESMELPFIGYGRKDSTTNKLGFLFGKTNEYQNETGFVAAKGYALPEKLSYIKLTDDCSLTGAFRDCRNIKKIDIADGVTSIPGGVFFNCGIEEITISDSVNFIGWGTFYGCSNLKKMTLPFIGVQRSGGLFGTIFSNMRDEEQEKQYEGSVILSQVTKVKDENSGQEYYVKNIFFIPENLTEVTVTGGNISNSAFYNCSNLKSIKISDTTEIIGESAFYNCIGIKNLNIPETTKSIGAEAFKNCVLLESMVVPSSVEKIGEGVFNGCDSLKELELPYAGAKLFYELSDDVRMYPLGYVFGKTSYPESYKVEQFAYKNNAPETKYYAYFPISLKRILINDGLIKSGTLCRCEYVQELELRQPINYVAKGTFSNYTDLKKIIIKSGIQKIGEHAFSACEKLRDVYFVGTREMWDKINIMKYNEPLLKANIHFINSRDDIGEIEIIEKDHVKLSVSSEYPVAGEKITISEKHDYGYRVSAVYLDGKKLDSDSFVVTKKHHVITYDIEKLNLESISIGKLPNKLEYIECKEEFDTSGGVLILNYGKHQCTRGTNKIK